MNTKLTKSILNRIEQEDITPRSKWYYRIQYSSFWFLFGAMLVLGALSFAVMLFALNNTDFDIFQYVDNGGLQQLLSLMPFFWVFITGLAVGLAVWGIKHTKRGYKLALLLVFGGNVFGSMLLGTLVYGAGGGEVIEEIIEQKVPQYQSVREKNQKFWGTPEETGRLAGLVESVSEKSITLSDPMGRTWTVDIAQAKLPPEFSPQVGKPLKMKGQVTGTGEFTADGIKPARKQERIHQKSKRHFEKNPELRAKFKSYLSPETRQKLEDVEANGERPSRELHEQIREEIDQNTTPEERRELRSKPDNQEQPSQRRGTRIDSQR